MEKWINLVETTCDPSREEEFNDWYDNIHLPNCLESPGYVAARRFVAKEFRDGRGKYLTIYYIETDDIDKTMEMSKEKCDLEQAYDSHLIIPIWRSVLWRQIAELVSDKETKKSERWINLTEVNCAIPSREDEFNEWFNNIHLYDAIDEQDYVAARRYVAKEFRDGRGKYLCVYEIETDNLDKTMEERLKHRTLERKEGRGSDLWISVWVSMQFRLITERIAHNR